MVAGQVLSTEAAEREAADGGDAGTGVARTVLGGRAGRGGGR